MSPYTWYVQKQADYYRKMLVPVPDHFSVYPAFREGLEEKEWVRAFACLRRVMEALYADMCTAPAAYGLPLIDTASIDTHSTKARESLAAVWRVPNLLYSLCQCGELQEGVLVVDRADFDRFSSAMKLKGIPLIVERLTGLGFDFGEWQEGKLAKAVAAFPVAYPDEPSLMSVLKGFSARSSLSLKGTKGYVNTHFYALDYKMMQDVGPELPAFTLSDFYSLAGESNAAFVEAFRRYLARYEYSLRIEEDVIYKAVIVNSRGKDTREYLLITDYHDRRDGLLMLRLKLDHIADYIALEQWTHCIDAAFRSATPCKHRKEHCAMRLFYDYDGSTYKACVADGDVFSFYAPTLADLPQLQQLYDRERQYA